MNDEKKRMTGMYELTLISTTTRPETVLIWSYTLTHEERPRRDLDTDAGHEPVPAPEQASVNPLAPIR
jgi:hypothetical protein